MNVALRARPMSREQFLDWAAAQEAHYEFDGFQPIAMTGGTVNHSRMIGNLNVSLRARLAGSACEPLGPDAGIATVDDAVRYPDALVTCTKVNGTDRLVPNPVVVFEVLSPTSGRTDRIDKLQEYHAVPSIMRYVILEHTSAALTVFHRAAPGAPWTAVPLTAVDTLPLPELGIEIPVAELYEGVDLPEDQAATQA